jgi:hypothetical protein
MQEENITAQTQLPLQLNKKTKEKRTDEKKPCMEIKLERLVAAS